MRGDKKDKGKLSIIDLIYNQTNNSLHSTVLVLTPFWFLNEYYGLLYTKLHYIGPVESILEGLEILEVLSEELKLPGLKGLCLEPT